VIFALGCKLSGYEAGRPRFVVMTTLLNFRIGVVAYRTSCNDSMLQDVCSQERGKL
jgi:hypothetical protein